MISPARWQRVKEILHEALDLPEQERPAYVAAACAGDEALRTEVENYLRHQDTADRLDAPALAPRQESDPTAQVGSRLGRYEIVRALGTGGMGEVFEARQHEPFVRTVALKLLRRDVITPALRARFDAERQALAMMNHPHIAQVFDADWTASGRPYIVMEFVPGQAVTDACREAGYDLDTRIALFEQVCDAVAHAHQRGLIHRDLKPSNVLLTDDDGAPSVKIIDFGIAKGAQNAPVGDAGDGGAPTDPSHTRLGDGLGTSGYASPEQVLGLPVDTRTDVFALGTVLYELVCEHPAFDAEALREIHPDERRAYLQRQHAAAPSAHPASRAQRARLRPDIDAIVAKALAFEPADRYASVAEMARDVRRHREGRPVRAVAAGRGYALGRYVRRHALGVALGVAFALALIAASVVSSIGYVRALRAEEHAAREADAARHEAEKSERVARFLADLFRDLDPSEGAGEALTVSALLARGAERADAQLSAEPDVRAMLLDTIGTAFMNLGEYDAAATWLGEAHELRVAALGAAHLDTARSLNHLGKLEYYGGRYAQAAGFYERAFDIVAGNEGESGALRAEVLNNRGELAIAQGALEEAEAFHRDALALRRATLGELHRDVGMSWNNLAGVLRQRGDQDGARDAYREAIVVNKATLGSQHPEVATNLSNLGVFLMSTGRYDDAVTLHEEALVVRRAALPPDHPHIANSLHNLGSLRVHLGDYDAALPLVRESLAMHRELHGDEHPVIALSLNNLGVVQENQSQLSAAQSTLREALTMFRATTGDAHPYTAICKANLAGVLVRLDDSTTALDMAVEARDALTKAFGGDHWRVAVANSVAGEALGLLGDRARASELLAQSLATIEKAQGPSTPYARAARARLERFHAGDVSTP